jgi:hypothetical protein
MAHSLLALSVQSKCNVAQSATGSDNGRVSCLVDSDAVEAPHIDNEMPILTTKTMRTIAMAASFRIHSHIVLYSARHCILHLLDRTGNTTRMRVSTFLSYM